MSFTDYQQSVLLCLSSNEPIIQNAAEAANSYTEMLKAGQISKDEYTELMLDIQRQINIDVNVSELDAKEKLHVAISGLITIATMV